ncbi:MAG: GreA/GreB family elongation factor [Bacteroidetes bacterium]|jgi:regulator of nucleoside diphosphate kinase|nr:GreA/GreB family elongation factor [Bacteroidota bacterium]MCB0603545.1 GreA/GreB family elongation factor [Saprospiraceae bacterium]MCO5278307.1 GreA/GreB family elongation factor [Saprospiraceae bacterium]HMT76271.1 GreA/GreB family elongation factor [Saprospiraceae bacterium]HQU95977.1 GreA/GreB family elongation factor [Saprospiraceae bacterium]
MIPKISDTEYKLLKGMILNFPVQLKTKEVSQLGIELERAEVVPDDQLESTIIRLNSGVEIRDEANQKLWNITITLPEDADTTQQKISVFSPLGVALIGFGEGHIVEWKLPGGLKKLKILSVSNK